MKTLPLTTGQKNYLSRHNLFIYLDWLVSKEGWITSSHFIDKNTQSPPINSLVVTLKQIITIHFLVTDITILTHPYSTKHDIPENLLSNLPRTLKGPWGMMKGHSTMPYFLIHPYILQGVLMIFSFPILFLKCHETGTVYNSSRSYASQNPLDFSCREISHSYNIVFGACEEEHIFYPYIL